MTIDPKREAEILAEYDAIWLQTYTQALAANLPTKAAGQIADETVAEKAKEKINSILSKATNGQWPENFL